MNPSGEQYEIHGGADLAVVTEVGATLRELWLGGREVLDGFAREEMASGGRGQLLMPWPNRIRDGAYRGLQLPLSEPAHRNAIHGLVRWEAWRPAAEGRFTHTIHPQPGYPFSIELEVRYALEAGSLEVAVTATNRGVAAAPFGCGSHPYLKPRGALGDALLRVPARSYLEVDERLVPTGRRLPVAGTAFDFRQPRAVGDAVLDTCYADFEEPLVEFDGLRVEWDRSFAYAQLFTGDTLSPERRRRSLATEPMSCPPDAFNSGEGLVTLEPEQTWTGSWSIMAT